MALALIVHVCPRAHSPDDEDTQNSRREKRLTLALSVLVMDKDGLHTLM